MKGVIIRMEKRFSQIDHLVHVRVYPSGITALAGKHADEHARAVGGAVGPIHEDVERINAKNARGGSQLLTVRLLSLQGWRVASPTLWEEAEI